MTGAWFVSDVIWKENSSNDPVIKEQIQVGILSSSQCNMQVLVIFDKAPRTTILVVTIALKHPWLDPGLSCQEEAAAFFHLLRLHI